MYVKHVIIEVAIVFRITNLTYVAWIERHVVARIVFAIEIFLVRCLSVKCNDDVVKLCIFCSEISNLCRGGVGLVFERCVVCEVSISCLRVISEEFLIWQRERILSLKLTIVWLRRTWLLTCWIYSESLLLLLRRDERRKKSSLCCFQASLIYSFLFVIFLFDTVVVLNDFIQ